METNVSFYLYGLVKAVHGKSSQSIDFLKFLLQSGNELLESEMQKNWGSLSLFQR